MSDRELAFITSLGIGLDEFSLLGSIVYHLREYATSGMTKEIL